MSGICQVCGCTETDCRGCIERTGEPCEWANEEHTLCTACVEPTIHNESIVSVAIDGARISTRIAAELLFRDGSPLDPQFEAILSSLVSAGVELDRARKLLPAITTSVHILEASK
jgi:hypothetical protein